jgi:CHASE2 domain-containing sensor protein
MSNKGRYSPAPKGGRFGRVLGWTILVLGMPLALLAALIPSNEYQATLGIDALDCDGLINVAIFAIPALFIYAAGFVVNAIGWRNRAKRELAIACAVICVAVAANLVRAVIEDGKQQAACLVR